MVVTLFLYVRRNGNYELLTEYSELVSNSRSVFQIAVMCLKKRDKLFQTAKKDVALPICLAANASITSPRVTT